MAQESAVQGLAAAVAPAQTEVAPQTTEKPAADPMASERLAQMARKEKALRQQVKAFQEQKKQWEEQSKATNKLTPEEYKARLLSDPTSLGLTHDEVANLFINQPKPEDIQFRKLQAEIEALKSEHTKTVESVTTAQKQAYDQAIKQITNEVKLLVDGNEAFETVKATGSEEAIVALIESTYKEEGVLMSVEDAAKQVEDYLYNQALTLAKLKKVSSALAPKEEPKEEVPQGKKQVTFVAKEASKEKQPTTLTHSITQQTTTKNSGADKRARAIAAFLGQTK